MSAVSFALSRNVLALRNSGVQVGKLRTYIMGEVYVDILVLYIVVRYLLYHIFDICFYTYKCTEIHVYCMYCSLIRLRILCGSFCTNTYS